MRNEEQQAHLVSTQHACDRGRFAQRAYIWGKDIQRRLMALLFPSVCRMTAALAELIVERHSTAKSMCQVTVAMKCSMYKKGKGDIFLILQFHLPMVMGFSWVATDDISCQINVEERRRENFYFVFFPLSGGCGDLF